MCMRVCAFDCLIGFRMFIGNALSVSERISVTLVVDRSQ